MSGYSNILPIIVTSGMQSELIMNHCELKGHPTKATSK